MRKMESNHKYCALETKDRRRGKIAMKMTLQSLKIEIETKEAAPLCCDIITDMKRYLIHFVPVIFCSIRAQ